MKSSPSEINNEPKISSFNTNISSFSSINLGRKLVMPIIIKGHSVPSENSKKANLNQ